METCEYWSSCALFNEFQEKRLLTLDEIKEEYCAGNYSRCARYMIHRTHGPRKVPNSLLPKDIHMANKILDDLEIKLNHHVALAPVQQKLDRSRVSWLVVNQENNSC